MRKLTLPTVLLPLLLAAPVVLAATVEQKQTASETVDKNAQTIFDISDSIFYFGELGMQETESTKLLKDTLEAAGFKVDLGGDVGVCARATFSHALAKCLNETVVTRRKVLPP